MSDKEARALGAGDSIEVEGVDYRLTPIGMQQLQEIQRAAIKAYKREYLSTYSENMDLLGESGKRLIEKEFERVARWDISDLPVKMAHDVRKVPITEQLVTRLKAEYGEIPTGEGNESTVRAVLSMALDAGSLTFDDVAKLTGAAPRRGRVPYDSWWITAAFEGMVTFVWTSVKNSHPGITKEEVGNWPLIKIAEAARIAESLTAPSLGNT